MFKDENPCQERCCQNGTSLLNPDQLWLWQVVYGDTRVGNNGEMGSCPEGAISFSRERCARTASACSSLQAHALYQLTSDSHGTCITHNFHLPRYDSLSANTFFHPQLCRCNFFLPAESFTPFILIWIFFWNVSKKQTNNKQKQKVITEMKKKKS